MPAEKHGSAELETGFRVSLLDDNRIRTFVVAIADRQKAEEAIRHKCRNVTEIIMTPFVDGELEKFALTDGQIKESGESNA